MSLPKTLTYSVLGITAVAAGLTSGLLISNNAQTNTNANSSTSISANSTQQGQPPMGGHRGGPGMMGDKGANNEQRKAVMDALASKDYDAWKKAVAADTKDPNKDTLLSKVDTQDKFNKLADAHNAVKTAHDNEEAVRKELGLPTRPEPGQKGQSSSVSS